MFLTSRAADKTAVTVTFSEFYVEAGPGIPISANRKQCQLALGVKVPAEFTFGVVGVDYVSHSSACKSFASSTQCPGSEVTTNLTARSRHRSSQFFIVSVLSTSYVFDRELNHLLALVQGQLVQSTARSSLTGPVAGKSYTYRDQFDLLSTNLSPCGVNTVLNVNSELQVSNSANTKGSGYVATSLAMVGASRTLIIAIEMELILY